MEHTPDQLHVALAEQVNIIMPIMPNANGECLS